MRSLDDPRAEGTIALVWASDQLDTAAELINMESGTNWGANRQLIPQGVLSRKSPGCGPRL